VLPSRHPARTSEARHVLKDERAAADLMGGQRCRLSCVEAGPAAWSCGPTHAYQGVGRRQWTASAAADGQMTCGTTLGRGIRPALSLFWTPHLAARVHPRPGAVRAPTGGSGHFMALQIPTGAGEHARIERYGLMWPRSTYSISARSRPGLEPRSRRDRVRAARPPKAVATYLGVRTSPCICNLRRESCWDSPGGANGARPRAHPLWGPGPGRRKM